MYVNKTDKAMLHLIYKYAIKIKTNCKEKYLSTLHDEYLFFLWTIANYQMVLSLYIDRTNMSYE